MMAVKISSSQQHQDALYSSPSILVFSHSFMCFSPFYVKTNLNVDKLLLQYLLQSPKALPLFLSSSKTFSFFWFALPYFIHHVEFQLPSHFLWACVCSFNYLGLKVWIHFFSHATHFSILARLILYNLNQKRLYRTEPNPPYQHINYSFCCTWIVIFFSSVGASLTWACQSYEFWNHISWHQHRQALIMILLHHQNRKSWFVVRGSKFWLYTRLWVDNNINHRRWK